MYPKKDLLEEMNRDFLEIWRRPSIFDQRESWLDDDDLEILEIQSLEGLGGSVKDFDQDRFSPRDISTLLDYAIDPLEAQEYDQDFGCSDILLLNWLQVTPEGANTDKVRNKGIIELFHAAGLSIGRQGGPGDEIFKIETGAQSMVILVNRKEGYSTAYKIFPDKNEEAKLLKKVWDKSLAEDYVVQYIGTIPSETRTILEIDYIKGTTLFELLKEGPLGEKEAIRYGFDILRGLEQLFRCQIRHYDLWLGNVMINDTYDRATIIDLGRAGTEPPVVDWNRRYGGENDLQSLGQILYKMATGHHLFNPTIDKSTHLIPDEVKAERERTYADPSGFLLQKRLDQVDANIEKYVLVELINYCLQARGTDKDFSFLGEKFNQTINSRNGEK
jgi:serine/threonine protein kinase